MTQDEKTIQYVPSLIKIFENKYKNFEFFKNNFKQKHSINLDDRNIVMDLLDYSLLDIIASNDGLIPFTLQKQIVNIWRFGTFF